MNHYQTKRMPMPEELYFPIEDGEVLQYGGFNEAVIGVCGGVKVVRRVGVEMFDWDMMMRQERYNNRLLTGNDTF